MSPHFKKGGEPVCTITYSADGTSASTTCTATLRRPRELRRPGRSQRQWVRALHSVNKGQNPAPGQNRVLERPASSSTTFPASEIKNGNLTITTNPAVLTAAPTVSGDVAGCPNNNWTGVDPVVTVASITLVISQPPGSAIFNCTASDPNGLSSPVRLTCTSP